MTKLIAAIVACCVWMSAALAAVPTRPGYDIIIIAGQSNAIGWGECPPCIEPPRLADFAGRVKQLGRYGVDDHRVIPVVGIAGALQHHGWINGLTRARVWLRRDVRPSCRLGDPGAQDHPGDPGR